MNVFQSLRKVCLAPALAVALVPARPGEMPAAEVLTLTLDEAIAMALERNEDVRVARETVFDREAQVREIRADALPNLTGDVNYTRNLKLPILFFGTDQGTQQISIGEENAYDFSLNLEQTIDIFGRVPKALGVAHLFSEMGEEDVRRVETEVILEVSTRYYAVILAEELAQVAGMALEQAEASLAQVEAMYRQGTRSRFELLRSRVEAANRRPELIRARNDVEVARSRFRRIVGLPLDREIELTDPLAVDPFEMDVEEGVRLAFQRRPEILSIHKEEEMRRTQSRLAGLERFPTLTFRSRYLAQGQTSQGFPDSEEFARSWDASVAISVPIFDGLRARSRIDQTRAQLSMSRYRRTKTEEEVRLEVIEAFRDLESASEEIRSQKANVEEAEESYRLAQVRFRNGLATQLDVRDVELALNRARTNFVQSLYDYNIALARVRKAIGADLERS